MASHALSVIHIMWPYVVTYSCFNTYLFVFPSLGDKKSSLTHTAPSFKMLWSIEIWASQPEGSVHMVIITVHTVEEHLTGESHKGPQETIV